VVGYGADLTPRDQYENFIGLMVVIDVINDGDRAELSSSRRALTSATFLKRYVDYSPDQKPASLNTQGEKHESSHMGAGVGVTGRLCGTLDE
jgi:hypothetical protein